MAAILYMDAVIAPNRSMGETGLKIVVGVLAGMAAVISLFFMLIGGWAAPIFLGLDVVLAYVALKASLRALSRRERLRVSAETVEVVEEYEGDSRTVWTSPTAFTNVDLEALGEHEMRVRLRLSGKRHSVGKALSPPEREALGQALREAIRRARFERHTA